MSKLPSAQRMQSSLVQTPLFSPFRKGRRNAIQSTADPEGRWFENARRSGFWTPHHPVTSPSDRLSGGEIIWDRRAVVGRVHTQAKNSVRHYTGHAAAMTATDWTLCSARLGSYLCRVRMDTVNGASVLVSIPGQRTISTQTTIRVSLSNKAISQEVECCCTEYHISIKPVPNGTCWFGQDLIKSFFKYAWVQMTLS